MKPFRIIPLLTLALLALASCGERKSTKPSSQGPPYEVIVVASDENWEGALGDTIKAVMQENIPVFNSAEPHYTLRRILPNNFKGVAAAHRNIVIVNVGEQYETPRMLAQYDVQTAPQLVVRLVGPDRESLTQYISDHRSDLIQVFEIAERDRDLALSRRAEDKILSQKVEEKFGFKITLAKGYLLRSEKPDFMWISREYPLSSQGLVIYSYPYTDRSDFSLDSLLSNRNRFVKLVPGPSEGSYMTTSPVFVPRLTHLRIHGRYWAEMRGFWDVENDFMGGPFVSYSTLDTENNRVVTIDCYVYSPDPTQMRRNLYRQMEHLIYSVSFPSNQQPDGEKAGE